jgi:UDP:flavonoid glycosyltransferase YjiC (YdhE family)
MITIVFYISGHGLGHVTRVIEVVQAVLAIQPDVRIVARTGAQPWPFALRAPEVELQRCEVDTGIVQIDSLRMDEDRTVCEAARFYSGFDRRVADEAQVLRQLEADVVVGDIPPLAFAAAARARIPSVALGNFTWDWIYSAYPAFGRVTPDVLSIVRHAYSQATVALRLPFHGGFEPMAAVTRDVPLVARRSVINRSDIRRALDCPGDIPIVLLSFGAYGVELPSDTALRSNRFRLVTAAREPPRGLRYEDLVAASDVVISKPGYGIVSECIANGAALLYTSRGRFPEYDIFVAEMPRFLRCCYISQDDLIAGRWEGAIDALLAQPAPPERPRVDGAGVVAAEILKRAS